MVKQIQKPKPKLRQPQADIDKRSPSGKDHKN